MVHFLEKESNVIGANLLQGGHYGKAYGFTTDSLDKFGDTHANKTSFTFINYIASVG